MYSTLCAFLTCILLVQGTPISNNPEVNDAADSLAAALNTFVNAKGNELMEVVDQEVEEVKGDLDDHSAQLRTLEEELQTLSETGSIIGCKGIVHDGYCYFLVNQRYSMDSAVLSCQRDESELAQFDDQDGLDAVHDYIIHTDQVTDKSTIFVWTAMHADDNSAVLNNTDNWLAGFPVSENTGNPSIMWQVMSDEFYLYHDGFFTAPEQVTAYPLCKKQVIPESNDQATTTAPISPATTS